MLEDLYPKKEYEDFNKMVDNRKRPQIYAQLFCIY